MPELPDKDLEHTLDLASRSSEALDAGLAAGFRRRSEPPQSSLGDLRPMMLRAAEGESDHVVKPKSDAMPSREDTGDRYQLSGEIARGGMGAVLHGRDVDLGRDLAVKILLEKYANRPEVARRFIEEAQIGGQLQHPGVVPVYDVGRFGDRPFFTMKLVKGHTLAHILGERGQPTDSWPSLLGIVLKVTETLAYAHAKGVIHRDLKPANVMVGAFGEVQVMDWGLAKVLTEGGVADEERAGRAHQEPDEVTMIRTARSSGSVGTFGTETEIGSLLGTPAYMPPEQANGDIARLDRRADVFGLGAILCEILTGKPPYVGRSGEEVRRKAVNGDLADATARLDACKADMELIALTKECLSPEAIDRPKDAQALADRLSAYLNGVQERLRQAELTGVQERARRRLTTVVAASILAISIAGGLGFTYWLQQRQKAAARTALALQEATLLRDQAVANPDDTDSWAAALDGVQRAEDTLTGYVDASTQEQVTDLGVEVRTGAKTAERDRALIAKLVDIRTAAADDRDGLVTDSAYTEAFKVAGIDVEALEPAAAGKQIADHSDRIRHAMVAALDHWSAYRKGMGTQGANWPKLVAIARAADPDRDRDAMRAALAIKDKPQRLEQVRPLAERADGESWAPASLVLLANTLADAGDVEAGVRVLRRASGIHPSDIWIHYTLGSLLQTTRPPRLKDAVEAYAAARALRPETGHDLAHVLEELGRTDEAEAIFRDLVRRRPELGRHLTCLAQHLKAEGRDDEAGSYFDRALVASRKAVELDPASSSAHYTLGRVFSYRGQFDDAVVHFRKTVELAPESGSSHYNLGTSLIDIGELDEAIACLRRAIEIDPNHGEAHTNLGNVLSKRGLTDEAMACYRKAIEINPRIVNAHTNLGMTLAEQQRWEDSIACFQKAIEISPRDTKAHFLLGNTLRMKGELDEAMAYFRKAIELNPRNMDAHASLGAVLSNLKRDYDGAMIVFRKAIEINPKSAALHTNLGITLARKGLLDEAIACFHRAIEVDPNFAMAHKSLGKAYSGRGMAGEAIACFRKAVECDPKNPSTHFDLGVELGIRGLADDAIASYRKAIELEPKHVLAHKELGIVFANLGQPDAAIVSLRRAVELDANDAGLHHVLGAMLLEKGELVEAIHSLNQALELNPKLALAHAQLGKALHGKQKIDEAIASFRRAIELDPTDAFPHFYLGCVLCDDKMDYDGAIASLRKALERRPEVAATHSFLARALAGKGMLDEAIASNQRAIELDPHAPQPNLGLGEVLRRQGRFAESLKAFRRGHELGSKLPGWPFPSADWVRDAEVNAALEAKLPAVLSGEIQPRDAAECRSLAQVCHAKKLYASAARFLADAFAADPRLADDLNAHHRYNAACYAVLAAGGAGLDTPPLDDVAKAKLRGQARAWLKADLAQWAKGLQMGAYPDRSPVQKMLRLWQQDPDLAAIRDADALAKLPSDEQKELAQLWADVADLLKRAVDG